MSNNSLQGLLDTCANPVSLLRNSQIGAYVYAMSRTQGTPGCGTP
jgi:hypothetical protein